MPKRIQQTKVPCLPSLPKGPTMHGQQLLVQGVWLLFLDQAKNKKKCLTNVQMYS